MNVQSEFVQLEKESEDVYLLPDDEWMEPFAFEFHFSQFDIKNENIINTYLSVTRNQGIEGINPRFVYQTSEVSFIEELFPFIKRTETIQLARFTETEFKERLMVLADGFGSVTFEVYYKNPLGNKNGNPLYSYIPVFYTPGIVQEQCPVVIARLYDGITRWINTNIGEVRDSAGVRIYTSFHDKNDPSRNLAELTSIEFEV